LKKRDHAMERRIVELINEARIKGRKCGNKYYKATHPLAWNDKLGETASRHSLDMARNGFLSHTGSDGTNPGERISRAGYKWLTYGEDVGQGYRTPEEVVDGWLKSEIHCKNIMNPEFREAGSAYAKSSSLRIYWTIVFGTQR
jgi:uncharacterized protein YkwD